MVEFVRPPDPLIGATIDDQYIIERKLGAGGMGTVYRATQAVTERPIALKVVHPQLIDDAMLERFAREAVVVGRLDHPHIVTVFAYGQDQTGPLYIAMECVEGDELSQVIERDGPMEPGRAIEIGIQCAEALAYAHQNGVIHRDIKPENIMLTTVEGNDVVKLLDFGLARVIDSESFKTTTGKIFGSPAFMSLEQWFGDQSIDARTDIYSLGCVLYNGLTGQLPYRADSPLGYIDALSSQTPAPPSELRPELAEIEGLDEVIMRCLAVQRDERYDDALEVAEGLRALVVAGEAIAPGSGSGQVARARSSAPRARPSTSTAPASERQLRSRAGWLGAAVVLLLGAGLTVWLSTRTPTASRSADSELAALAVETDPRAAAQTTATASPEHQPSQALDGSTVARPDAVDQPDAVAVAAEPTPIELTVDTEPEGAEVMVGTRVLGVAPQTVVVSPDATLDLTVRLRGRSMHHVVTHAEAEQLAEQRLVLKLPSTKRASSRTKAAPSPIADTDRPPEPEKEPEPSPKPVVEPRKLPIE